MAFCVLNGFRLNLGLNKKTKYFGTFSVISVIIPDYRNKPSFGTVTDTENVPECTGKNVPVFPVHFQENVPKFETLTETHGLTPHPFSG